MPLKGNATPTPCPSEQAYRRHIAHGEQPCDGCRQAHLEYGRAHRPPPVSTSGIHIGEQPLGPGECGTIRGYRWHRKAGEPTCQACRNAHAEDRRARHGKATGTQPGRAMQPCGTPAAYARHLQHAEEPCDECRAAHAAYTNVLNKTARIVAAMTREAGR
jgi:hypothetical protein